MCSGSGMGVFGSSVEAGVLGSMEAIGVLWFPMEAVVASSSSCSMARAGGGGSWSLSTSL